MSLKTITVKASAKVGTRSEWPAGYFVRGTGDVRHIAIEARSAIEVVVAKIITNPFEVGAEYYISSPNYGVAIPGISSLEEDFWIHEKLVGEGMPLADAITVARVLLDMGDF